MLKINKKNVGKIMRVQNRPNIVNFQNYEHFYFIKLKVSISNPPTQGRMINRINIFGSINLFNGLYPTHLEFKL